MPQFLAPIKTREGRGGGTRRRKKPRFRAPSKLGRPSGRIWHATRAFWELLQVLLMVLLGACLAVEHFVKQQESGGGFLGPGDFLAAYGLHFFLEAMWLEQ